MVLFYTFVVTKISNFRSNSKLNFTLFVALPFRIMRRRSAIINCRPYTDLPKEIFFCVGYFIDIGSRFLDHFFAVNSFQLGCKLVVIDHHKRCSQRSRVPTIYLIKIYHNGSVFFRFSSVSLSCVCALCVNCCKCK